MIEAMDCGKMSGCCQSKGLDPNRIVHFVLDRLHLLFTSLGQSRRNCSTRIKTNIHLDR